MWTWGRRNVSRLDAPRRRALTLAGWMYIMLLAGIMNSQMLLILHYCAVFDGSPITTKSRNAMQTGAALVVWLQHCSSNLAEVLVCGQKYAAALLGLQLVFQIDAAKLDRQALANQSSAQVTNLV